MRDFERVYTVTDYYDGPRQGIAEYQGRPHLYQAEWDEEHDNYADTFVLSPITDEVLQLALEDWEIWLRWESAFREGRAFQDSHPALSEDRARHEQLKAILEENLRVDPARHQRVRADFRPVDSDATPKRARALEVRWHPC